ATWLISQSGSESRLMFSIKAKRLPRVHGEFGSLGTALFYQTSSVTFRTAILGNRRTLKLPSRILPSGTAIQMRLPLRLPIWLAGTGKELGLAIVECQLRKKIDV